VHTGGKAKETSVLRLLGFKKGKELPWEGFPSGCQGLLKDDRQKRKKKKGGEPESFVLSQEGQLRKKGSTNKKERQDESDTRFR